MDLEIQTRHAELDPTWRDLIEQQVAKLTEKYPELMRVHVVLGHTRHHREGLEDVSIVANVRGTTLRAAKQAEQAPDALHAAFAALAKELQRFHEKRRRIVKHPGLRPQGSVKRIFRDAGYGFIHFRPGQDVYFQRSALQGLHFEDLRPGAPVEFEMEEGERGLQASKVFPVGERDLV